MPFSIIDRSGLKMDIIESFFDICRRKDIKSAIEFQKSLGYKINSKKTFRKISSVCAFDISYDKKTRRNFSTAIVMSYPDLKLIENRYLVEQAVFPYIPGLLAFREGPSIIRLYRKLKHEPDILLFDGHGLAHPRGTGIASMIGVLLDKPSIGCAKSRLVGEYSKPGNDKGKLSELRYSDKCIGKVLRTRKNVKPVFISIGHGIDLSTAVKITLSCCPKYRIPEPIREAHKLANEIRLSAIREVL